MSGYTLSEVELPEVVEAALSDEEAPDDGDGVESADFFELSVDEDVSLSDLAAFL